MKTLTLIATAFTMLASVAKADTIKVLQPSLYQRPSHAAAHFEVPMNLARFQGTTWTLDQIVSHVKGLAEVYEQCSIRFSEVKIYDMSMPLPNDLASRDIRGIQKLAEQTGGLQRPLTYLIETLTDTDKPTPFAKAQFVEMNSGVVPSALLNTIWFPSYVNSDAYLNERLASPYNVLAHEFGHILLLDGQHNGDDPGNLLSIWRRRNNTITPQQCAEMVKSKLLQPVVH